MMDELIYFANQIKKEVKNMIDYHAPLRKSEKHNKLMNELTQSSPSESLQG